MSAASYTANIGLGLKRQPLPGRQPYRDINLDILWRTVQEDLPPLIAELEKRMPEAED